MVFKKMLDYFILFVFVTGFLSALYMVFVVCSPDNSISPLWGSAKELPYELFVKRRLYAIEAWVIFGFMSLYLTQRKKILN